MKIKTSNLLALFFTISISLGASAQQSTQPSWVLVGTGDNGSLQMDKTSLKRNGEIVSVWIAQTLTIKKQNMSVKTLREYNCKTGQFRNLSRTVFEKPDFSGDIADLGPTGWEYAIRGSLGEDALNYACKNAPKQSFLDRVLAK